VHILAMEYRGYGIYEGQPNTANIESDALFLFDYLTETMKIEANQIIVFGRSIGSGPATTVASQRNPCCLLLVAAFQSIRSLVREKAGCGV